MENQSHRSATDASWNRRELRPALRARARAEQARRELIVDYYRIGYRLSFPLPVSRRPVPAEMPLGIATIHYPWMLWLSWTLEERWRVLHAAWRRCGDAAAGRLLQEELAALSGWDRFHEFPGQVGLMTGHIAGCLSLALADRTGWKPAWWRTARQTAAMLIERDVWPWFREKWAGPVRGKLANIPLIALVRSAQLARRIGSVRTDAIDATAADAVREWCRCRETEHHTEGTAYDGYLFDSITAWMEDTPRGASIWRDHEPTFRSLVAQGVDFSVPGHIDAAAPLADVEPQMPFWTTAVLRIARQYGWPEARWLASRVPWPRMPAAGLTLALEDETLRPGSHPAPPPRARAHAHGVALRTGWSASDLAVIVGLPRCPMQHLHEDSGHVIVGWRQRWWITDPGYQQYRPGEERRYTLDAQAHNNPVIGGHRQRRRRARPGPVESVQGWAHAGIEMAACYRSLPDRAQVQRDVWVHRDGWAVVRDAFASCGRNVDVSTSWQADPGLAWAFVDGWARLCDGADALWLGLLDGALHARQLDRHPGSRGPLTLTHVHPIARGDGEHCWVIGCDRGGGWTPPLVQVGDGVLSLRWSRRDRGTFCPTGFAAPEGPGR